MNGLSQFIRTIPDYPKPGILFKDITPCAVVASGFSHNRDCTGHLDALRWRAGTGFRFITVFARLTLQVSPTPHGGQNARF